MRCRPATSARDNHRSDLESPNGGGTDDARLGQEAGWHDDEHQADEGSGVSQRPDEVGHGYLWICQDSLLLCLGPLTKL